MNCVQFQCNNKKNGEKGQLVCLVYTIKLLCCIKSGVILRKFRSVLSLHIHNKCRFRKSTRFYLHILYKIES